MGIFNKLLGRKSRDRRVAARFRVKIGKDEGGYWTEDIAMGGIRLDIGKQLSLGDLTGGSRDVPLVIELDSGPIEVTAEPIWTVRLDDGHLATGWMFSSFSEDGRARLQHFIDSQ